MDTVPDGQAWLGYAGVAQSRGRKSDSPAPVWHVRSERAGCCRGGIPVPRVAAARETTEAADGGRRAGSWGSEARQARHMASGWEAARGPAGGAAAVAQAEEVEEGGGRTEEAAGAPVAAAEGAATANTVDGAGAGLQAWAERGQAGAVDGEERGEEQKDRAVSCCP